MSKIKESLVDMYRSITLPYRYARLAWDRKNNAVPIAVLYYHRVDDEQPNDWSISNENFEQHIDWLQKKFDLISLKEAHRRIASGKNDRPSVCITFDDGYADNCANAIPILIHRRIPVTYFVSWSHIVHQHPFSHDIANGQQLQPNSIESIRALSEAGVDIGCHTFTHLDLGPVTDEKTLRFEIVECKQAIEDAISKPVEFFAFPFGMQSNMNSRAFQMGREAGFLGMCSAYGGYNEIGDDAFHIQRLHGDPRLCYLKNWTTIDPRIRLQRRFNYSLSKPNPVPTRPPATIRETVGPLE